MCDLPWSSVRRLVGAAVLVLVALGSLVGAAGAQSQNEVLDELDNYGYYVEPGADVDLVRLEDMLERQPDLYVVILDGDASQTQLDDLAFTVNDQLLQPGHVVVVADNGYGSSSIISDDVATEAEAIVADEVFGSGTSAAATSQDTSGSGDDGGGGGAGFLIVLVVIGVVLVGGFFFLKSRNKKTDDGDVVAAKNEIKSQLSVVADQIFEHEDAVNLSENEQAIDYYRQANATYTQVYEALDRTDNLLELAELNDQIDLARWQMEAAEALIEGRAIPPKPEPDKPAACFFDPTHKPGTESATIRTSAGNKEVMVCRSCDDKLRQGQVPESRMIDVRGKKVPYAKAPRSHGGGGMGGLGMFEVIVGGLGAVLAGGGLGGGGGARRAPQPQPSRRSQPVPREPGRGLEVDWGGGVGGRRQRRAGGTFGPDLTPSPRTRRTTGTRKRRKRRT